MRRDREDVEQAILRSAADLFVERGPAATSIRDIAARSEVNHGLVFRYFGTKDNLIGAVLDYLSAEMTALLQSGAAPQAVEEALDRQVRVVARTLLDGYPAGQLQKAFPVFSYLAGSLQPPKGSDSAARLALFNALALQFGWRLFEPMLRAATGIEELTDAELRRAVGTEFSRIIGS